MANLTDRTPPYFYLSLCSVSFLDLPLQCLTLCSHVVLLFIALPQWTTNDFLSHHSCGRGPFRLCLPKEGLTLEMRVLELALNAKCCSVVILPKALPRFLGPSSNRTRLKVGTTTILIYQARWTAL